MDDLTGLWICDWCGKQHWSGSTSGHPPGDWISQTWPNGNRTDLCTDCTDKVEAGCALFTRLRHKHGWSKEETQAAARAIISEERQKYADFLDDELPEW